MMFRCTSEVAPRRWYFHGLRRGTSIDQIPLSIAVLSPATAVAVGTEPLCAIVVEALDWFDLQKSFWIEPQGPRTPVAAC